MSKYYCDRCGEEDPEATDGEYTFFAINLRPYDLFCSASCVSSHIQEIEGGEWSNWDMDGKGLEDYYKDEIKNNWADFPYEIVSADNLELIEKRKIKAFWWSWDMDGKGLEDYYKDEIKNIWADFPCEIVSADNLELIEK